MKPNKQTPKTVQGIISINARGVGFVTIENTTKDAPDIRIEPNNLKTALHRDLVEIEIQKGTFQGKPLGKVTQVIKRSRDQLVGTLSREKSMYFVVPDDSRIHLDIVIKKEHLKNAEEGQKVLVSLLPWTDETKSPEGIIQEIIGQKGEHNTEIQSIVLEKGFTIGFPKEVEDEATQIRKDAAEDLKKELEVRLDIRDKLTVTIDPIDAKDFDDAISFVSLNEKEVEIGVHIADVSHFVKENSKLDVEAKKRATSVYLVDRTIPMLPEILSNDLCSLNPNEDKLAFSAIFTLNRNTGEVVSEWFGKTVINSNKRFTYEEAQDIIVKGEGLYATELSELNRISKIFTKIRHEEGAIDFDQEEVKFKLDKNGSPLEVYKKERFDAHKLVEEYMLLANRRVALKIFNASKTKKGLIGLYRIHNQPEGEKIQNLALFLKALGHTLPLKQGKVSSKDINAMLKRIEGSAEEALIKTATIRSMAKAVYSPTNSGHFGLAFTYYTHFTSPIRRYPDLIVHRILEAHIKDLKVSQNEFERIYKIAENCSEREIKASEAERASIKMKQVEYMAKRIGEVFDGSISGVTEWGIYVEDVKTKCEGMVRLKDISGDYFVLDEKKYRIVGERTKKVYSLGDKVKFKVLRADTEKRTLDYGLVN